jgi:hypothetical protein
MRLKYNNKIMDHGCLRDFDLRQDAVVQLLGPRLKGGAEELQAHTIEPPKQIGFFVQLLDSRTVYLQACECDTIDAVKGMLQQMIDVPARQLRLKYNSKIMYEGSLRDFDLKQDAVVQVLGPPLRGGAVKGGAKRARTGSNPFERVEAPVVTPGDVALFQDACNASLDLKHIQNEIWNRITSIPDDEFQNYMNVLAAGKQQHDVKVRMLVELIPVMKLIKQARDKLDGSYEVLANKLASKIWSDTVAASTNNKFSVDVFKVKLETAFRDAAMRD